jgi:hypothetical protein
MSYRKVQGRYRWEGRGHRKKVNEGECGGCILYPYMKAEE